MVSEPQTMTIHARKGGRPMMVCNFRHSCQHLAYQCFLVFLDPKTYSYYNATMQKDDEPPRSYEGHYSTDLVSEKSIRFLDEAIHDRDHKPFFLVVTPIGPHSEEMDHKGDFDAPLPAHRHKDWYPDLKAPRTSNFNPDVVRSQDQSSLPTETSFLTLILKAEWWGLDQDP